MGDKKINFKLKVLIPIISIFAGSILFMSFINYKLLDSTVKTKTTVNLDFFTDNICVISRKGV